MRALLPGWLRVALPLAGRGGPRASWIAGPCAAAGLLAVGAPAHAAEPWLGNTICSVLVTVLPEVQSFDPEAARQRFVAALRMKFRDDEGRLRDARAAMDREAQAACRKEREGLLRVMGLLSLAEAFERPG